MAGRQAAWQQKGPLVYDALIDHGRVGGTLTLDFRQLNSYVREFTLTSDCCLYFIDPPLCGVPVVLYIHQDEVGGHSIRWMMNIEGSPPCCGEGKQPELCQEPGATTVVVLWWDCDKYHLQYHCDSDSSVSIGDGDVTTDTIEDGAVTNDKLANMPRNTLKGRLFGTGPPDDLAVDDFTEDTLDTQVWLLGWTNDTGGGFLDKALRRYNLENVLDGTGVFHPLSGDISATTGADTEINVNVVTNLKLADMPKWTLKGRGEPTNGDPQDLTIGDIALESAPDEGDYLLGWISSGELRLYDWIDVINAHGSHTGDVRSTGLVTTINNGVVTTEKIADDAVDNDKLADMAAWSLKGRNAATTGDPSDITSATATTKGSPETDDTLLGWDGTSGALVKYTIGTLPFGGAGGGGEANTGANLGAGTGVYHDKSGVVLQFHSLVSPGATIDISLDEPNGEIDLDLGDAKPYSILLNESATTKTPMYRDETNISTEATPATGDFVLGWDAGGVLKKFDIGTLPGANVIAVDTVSALSSADVNDQDVVILRGRDSVGDLLGGPPLLYDAGSSATVDNGLVFNGPGSVGRYLRIYDAVIDVTWFTGVDPTGTTDSETGIQAAIDAIEDDGGSVGGGSVLFFPSGRYLIGDTLDFYNIRGLKILGSGGHTYLQDPSGTAPHSGTTLVWTGTGGGTLATYRGNEFAVRDIAFHGRLDGAATRAGIGWHQTYTAGVGSGHGRWDNVYFSDFGDAAIKCATSSGDATCADLSFGRISFYYCTSGLQVINGQGVNYHFQTVYFLSQGGLTGTNATWSGATVSLNETVDLSEWSTPPDSHTLWIDTSDNGWTEYTISTLSDASDQITLDSTPSGTTGRSWYFAPVNGACFDFRGGGQLQVDYFHSVWTDRILHISGDSTVTGETNADFRFGELKFDSQQILTPVIVDVSDNTSGGNRVVKIESIRSPNAAFVKNDGRYVFNLAGSVFLHVEDMTYLPYEDKLLNMDGGGTYDPIAIFDRPSIHNTTEPAGWTSNSPSFIDWTGGSYWAIREPRGLYNNTRFTDLGVEGGYYDSRGPFVANVKHWGAMGDGSTDDSSAIQAAVDYLKTIGSSVGGGSVLYFPPGRYAITTTIDLYNMQGLVLRGEGAHGFTGPSATDPSGSFPQSLSVIEWTGTNGGTVVETAGSGLSLENLAIWGQSPGDTEANRAGVGFHLKAEAGLTSGQIDVCNCVFSGADVLVQCGEASGDAGCANIHFNKVRMNDCDSGLKVVNTAGTGYVFDSVWFEDVGSASTGACFDFSAGGMLHVHYSRYINVNRVLHISGDGTVTGENNANFVLDYMHFDATQPRTPVIVDISDNTSGGDRFVKIGSVRAPNAAFTFADGRYVFDLAGSCYLHVEDMSYMPFEDALLNLDGSGTWKPTAWFERCRIHNTGEPAAWDHSPSFVTTSGSGWVYGFHNIRDLYGNNNMEELGNDKRLQTQRITNTTASGSDSINLSQLGSEHIELFWTLTGDYSPSFSGDPPRACWITIKITQDATGLREIVWPTLSGEDPTVDMEADSITIVRLYFDGTNYHSQVF